MDIGAQLRTAREAMSLSIATLAQRTRVPARTLAAIERNDQTGLPPHPFGRGFVRTYAEEVDLDPDRTVRDYFAQFPEAPDSTRAAVLRKSPDVSWQLPSQWMGMGTAIAILVMVVAAAVVLGRRGDSAPEPNTIGTAGTSPAPTATTPVPHPVDQPAGTPTPAVAPAPAPAPSAITVVLSLTGPCWVAATVDGRRTIYQILQPGERHTLVAERDMAIRFGDAGAVAWTINGRDAGTLGRAGAVRDIRIDRDNAGTVK
jgi:transcriptional regulator with XRE-family HTH domain